MAADNHWRYEELQGSHDLLAALLATTADDRVLQVPPGFTTQFDAVARRLTALPPVAAAGGRGGKAAAAVEPAPRPAAAATEHRARRSGLGLGIDAGGTYTDAAIFDWSTNRVRAKAKAPTSHWDYAIGIDAALARLPEALLQQVAMVSVSTTLATNAIVEGKGQKVGLLLMPPMEDDDFESVVHHRPVCTVQGRMGIDGVPLQPVDAAEVRRVAQRLVREQDVRAFAVTGYASHVNPAHELEVKALLREVAGLPVTCGHEVSSIRNYRVRAETAALNARIVPCLQALMERLRDCLAGRGIRAPLMVVRSDGSLMNLEVALERPVETLLSGPAASVAGARHLCELPDALVIDIGGTTSDTAVLHDGDVRTDPDGATVGHWRTHVQALAVRTLGLGGDSEIRHDRHTWHVGPRRVTPICRLGENAAPATLDACLTWMEAHRAALNDPAARAVYARLPTPATAGLTPRQQAILAVLEQGPVCAQRLVQELGCLKPAFLDIEPLLENQLVRAFGFTPTDALHLLGRMAFWDAALARRYATLLGEPAGLDAQQLAQLAEELVVRRVSRELLMTRLVDLTGTRSVEGDHGFVARALLERGLGEARDALGVELRLGIPVIGIGAPAAFFLPGAAHRLNTETVIPTDGDVANAIGAITSGIRVERRAEIRPDEKGEFHVSGIAGAPVFAEMPAAQAFAEQALQKLVRDLAQKAGAVDPAVDLQVRDRTAAVADGEELFIGRTIVAVASGLPGETKSEKPQ
jgi:N-methylhydantoinase A/oxoprolinase/acetone carboxylase beta subunit